MNLIKTLWLVCPLDVDSVKGVDYEKLKSSSSIYTNGKEFELREFFHENKDNEVLAIRENDYLNISCDSGNSLVFILWSEHRQ